MSYYSCVSTGGVPIKSVSLVLPPAINKKVAEILEEELTTHLSIGKHTRTLAE